VFTIAVITEDIARQEKYVVLCGLAEKENQPMYAIIKEGVDWHLFQGFNWRKIYYYENDFELQWALEDILQDYRMYKLVKNIG